MFLCVLARFRRRSEAEALGLSVEEVRAIAQGNVRVWKKAIAPNNTNAVFCLFNCHTRENFE